MTDSKFKLLREICPSVSRETFYKLQKVESIIKKENSLLNLVSVNTLEDMWGRHFLDSAQLSLYIPKNSSVLDIGSGAGFPGMILHLLGYSVTVLDSTYKKCLFLQRVSRETGTLCPVVWGRAEHVKSFYSAITSRACAPLEKLLKYASCLLAQDGKAFFLKGESLEQEIQSAQKKWSFTYTLESSKTSERSYVCIIHKLQRKK